MNEPTPDSWIPAATGWVIATVGIIFIAFFVAVGIHAALCK